MNYEPVIGIEVHVELNTKTKMFCRCSADYFGKEPNTHTCPVCLGLPGALPIINEEAIKKCMQIGLALNCSVNEQSYFERKNYFYPDLAKGYQISQLVKPLCVNGWLIIQDESGEDKKIRINRGHQEEDTGKLTHIGSESLIDFNRSGVPLVEIVTEPDFHSSAEVKDYAQKLREILKSIGVSNADMERGDMRLEANISLREFPISNFQFPNKELPLPPYRVELKNINSFRFMASAIEYEIKRQSEALERGEKLTQETRGWDENKKETYLQRSKEESHDYRYFPEPDLPVMEGDRLQVLANSAKSAIEGKLPDERVGGLFKKYGISQELAAALIKQELVELFENVLQKSEKGQATQIAKYIINKKLAIDTPDEEVVSAIQSKTTNLAMDAGELDDCVSGVMDENQDAVKNYKNGNKGSLQFLLGQVLKKTQGRGNPAEIREKLLEKLGEK